MNFLKINVKLESAGGFLVAETGLMVILQSLGVVLVQGKMPRPIPQADIDELSKD